MKDIVIDSKLTFKIQEIPDGQSVRNIRLEQKDLDFEDLSVVYADVKIHFHKTRYFIKTGFTVEAVTELTCDRSLQNFEYKVSGTYEVLFKPDVKAISESEKGRVKAFNVHELTLSLDREVRDTIFLELPAKKLHPRYYDEDGNPEDFETRKFGSKTKNEDESIDPRWEPLKKLKN
ncbi:MAG: DUF177 domain-containing protein [Balneolaceae bacterium]